MHRYLLSTISASAALGYICLDCLAGMVMLLATTRVLRAPKNWFSFGVVAKVTWVIVSLWFTWQVGDVLLPIGAAVALWHLRALARRHAGEQAADLPFAPGSPVEKESDR